MPKTPKPPPEFENEDLREHVVVKKWKDSGFDDMQLLKLSEKFLQAYRKDKKAKDKAVAKAAKKAKLPIPEPPPELHNPAIDEPCFTKLLTTGLKITVPDTKALFKAANRSHSGQINFSEFVAIVGTLSKTPKEGEKLSLVFSMFDKDKDGELDPPEVELLLKTGLDALPGEDIDGKQAATGEIFKRLGPVGGDSSGTRHGRVWPPRRGYTKAQLEGALRNPTVYSAMPGDGGVGENGISEDQLFEATVVRSSRLCAIL